MREMLFHFGAQVALERPKRSLDQHALRLEQGGKEIEAALKAATGSERNCKLLSHVIGIERWGQRRLQTALGEPLVMDEYDGYRPPRDRDWTGLLADFRQTRQETLALVRKLEQAGLPADFRAPHNEFGPLSAGGWLRYLDMHARGEIRKLR